MSDIPARILVVDDDDDIREIMRVRLGALGYVVSEAENGIRGLACARETLPDLIVLDVMMPGMDGIAVKKALGADTHTALIPVIFLTAKSELRDKVDGLHAGGDDYMVKPFDIRELSARIEALLRRRAAYERLALTDGLTGVFNRSYFERQLQSFFLCAQRYQQGFSLALIDIDNFKKINDTFGHAAGDCVLKAVADATKSTLRDSDIVTRYGGDEFAVILPYSSDEQAYNAMQRVKEKIAGIPVSCSPLGQALHFSVSAGAVFCDGRAADKQQLFSQVDRAMYEDKRGHGKRSTHDTVPESPKNP